MKKPIQSEAAAPVEGVEIRSSPIHGLGVFALKDFAPGEEIGIYAGRRFPPGKQHKSWNDQLTYLFGLSDGSTIDGAQKGNAMRHLNHACSPNVEAMERNIRGGKIEIAIFAIDHIEAGQELFLNYSLDVDAQDADSFPCACGTVACTGTMAAVSEPSRQTKRA
jgi:SET domain-containing protein